MRTSVFIATGARGRMRCNSAYEHELVYSCSRPEDLLDTPVSDRQRAMVMRWLRLRERQRIYTCRILKTGNAGSLLGRGSQGSRSIWNGAVERPFRGTRGD